MTRHLDSQNVFKDAINMMKRSLGLKYARTTATRALTISMGDLNIVEIA